MAAHVRIDTRWTAGDTRPHAQTRSGIVRAGAGRYLGLGRPVVGALLEASRTTPIVFTLTVDPVGACFVASLARPRAATSPDLPGYLIRPRHGNGWELLKEDRTARAACGHPSRCEQPGSPAAQQVAYTTEVC